MDIFWPIVFGEWLDKLEDRSREGDEHSIRMLVLVAAALDHLRNLAGAPTREAETATLKRVRQSGRYEVWRVSHPFGKESPFG